MARMTPAAVVLVVDDDASIRKSLSRLISEAGYDVQAYASPGGSSRASRRPAGVPCPGREDA